MTTPPPTPTPKVVGLRTKFPARVRVVGLGATAAVRGRTPDYTLEIAEKDIQPEDIEMLTRELNLKETTPTTLDALVHAVSVKTTGSANFASLRPGATIETEDGKKVPGGRQRGSLGMPVKGFTRQPLPGCTAN